MMMLGFEWAFLGFLMAYLVGASLLSQHHFPIYPFSYDWTHLVGKRFGHGWIQRPRE